MRGGLRRDVSTKGAARKERINLHAKKTREIRVKCSDDTPKPHGVPPGEWLLRDVCENHPAHLVRELKTPRAHERKEKGGFQNSHTGEGRST